MELRFCSVSMATANKSRKSAELSPMEEDDSHALKRLQSKHIVRKNTGATVELKEGTDEKKI